MDMTVPTAYEVKERYGLYWQVRRGNMVYIVSEDNCKYMRVVFR
jgi:hypothetical protein